MGFTPGGGRGIRDLSDDRLRSVHHFGDQFAMIICKVHAANELQLMRICILARRHLDSVDEVLDRLIGARVPRFLKHLLHGRDDLAGVRGSEELKQVLVGHRVSSSGRCDSVTVDQMLPI
ncbi:MAG: hypothetical protein ACTII7_00915 [Galactobacter sp.]